MRLLKKIIIILIVVTAIVFCVAPSMGQCNKIDKENENSNTTITSPPPCQMTKKTLERCKYTKQRKKINTYKTGYIKDNNINIRNKPNKKSKIYTQYYFGTKVKYAKYNKKWAIIKYGSKKSKTAYVYRKYISKHKPKSKVYVAPNNKIMSYMSYEAITSVSSRQYELQQKAYTGTYGIRQVNGRYCIAVGSYYTTKIGTYIDLILKNGTVIKCILADCKADDDTDYMRQKTSDGSLVEFVVDIERLSKEVKKMGCVSYSCAKWNPAILKLKVYKKSDKYE